MRTGTFADTNTIGIATDQIEHFVADQMIVKHHVCQLHHLQTAQRQQTGIAWPGTDKNDFTLLLSRRFQLCGQCLFRALHVARRHLAGEQAVKRPLPETATIGHFAEAGFNPVTPASRHFSHLAKVGRQQRFQFFTQHTRQNRCRAAGGDRHH